MNNKLKLLLEFDTDLLKVGDVIDISNASKYKILVLCVTIDADRIMSCIINDSSNHALVSPHWGENGLGGVWKWELSLSGNKLTIVSGKEYGINRPPVEIGNPVNTYFKINRIFGII